jgi:hypothetical protein
MRERILVHRSMRKATGKILPSFNSSMWGQAERNVRILLQKLGAKDLCRYARASILAVNYGSVNSFPIKICMVEHVLFPILPTTIDITI